MSSSIGDALEFFKRIYLPNFESVDTIVKYCRIIDRI